MVDQLPKAIFFDWDGTLADSFSFIQSAHNYTLDVLGSESRSSDWFRMYFGQSRDFIYRDIYAERAAEAQKCFEAFVVAHHTDLLEPLSGAGDLLQTAQELGVSLGVVSNKRSDFIAAEMKAFGWEMYFSSLVGASEASEDKPSAAPLLLGMDRMGGVLSVDDIWYVGDTVVDMQCANNAKCIGVYYDYMGEDIAWTQDNRPHMTVCDCHALQNYLLGLVENT